MSTKKKSKQSKEAELKIDCKLEYVIIHRPDGLSTVCRHVPISYLDGLIEQQKNIKIQKEKDLIDKIDVTVDFKKHIAWSHSRDDIVKDISKQFSQKYFNIDMEI